MVRNAPVTMILATVVLGLWSCSSDTRSDTAPDPTAAETASQPRRITNSIGMELVYIPPGEFMMGSPDGESNRHSNEGPRHRVRITQGFYLGATEVTQGQWQAIMGNNPSRFSGSNNLPVESVFWHDAVNFCRRLGDREGKQYRLPTEAEWEYACRAGTNTTYSFGNNSNDLDRYAWYNNNSDRSTHEVGQKQPNGWGLYDMHGNVWEWCADWYGEDYYSSSPTVNPSGPINGSERVLRGGCWDFGAIISSSALRFSSYPLTRGYYYGCRVVLVSSSLD